MFVLSFAFAVFMGGFIFILYLYYMSNHHNLRMRKTGNVCKGVLDSRHAGGKYHPDTYPPADVQFAVRSIDPHTRHPGMIF